MSGTFGEQQAIQFSIHDMQGLKDAVKECEGSGDPLNSSDHKRESDLAKCSSNVSVHRNQWGKWKRRFSFNTCGVGPEG